MRVKQPLPKAEEVGKKEEPKKEKKTFKEGSNSFCFFAHCPTRGRILSLSRQPEGMNVSRGDHEEVERNPPL